MLLMGARVSGGIELESTRVEAVDRRALARCVLPLKGDRAGGLGVPAGLLHVIEPVAKTARPGLVLALGKSLG
jgi:hypothetical protein